MGLDCSHDAWHGGYGIFMMWRQCVAQAYGIPLNLMEGFWSISNPTEYLIKKSEYGRYFDEYERVLPLKWEAFAAPNCVKALLHHSDCDGEIEPRICGELAEELRAILPKLKSLFPRWTDADVRERAEQFAQGCEDACNANEPLEFR